VVRTILRIGYAPGCRRPGAGGRRDVDRSRSGYATGPAAATVTGRHVRPETADSGAAPGTLLAPRRPGNVRHPPFLLAAQRVGPPPIPSFAARMFADSPRRIALALAVLLAASACSRTGHGHVAAAAAQQQTVDWSSVSSRDLNVASVFLVARDVGLRQALDSLGVLARNDTSLEPLGHGIAHGLGRFAIAQHGYDLNVFAQCRPTFFSGCYHGVLEGYLSARHKVDPAELRAVCTSAEVLRSAPYVFRECAHGMGHGLAGARGHDLPATLHDCDAVLPPGVARTECYDGAFMENVVHSMGGPDVNVGDAMTMHHAHASKDEKLLKDDDPYFPCDSLTTGSWPASCWAYQPVVFYPAFHGDMAKVVAGCTHAPASAAGDCYRGLGKQTIGRTPTQPDEVIRICRTAGAGKAACMAGVVEFYVDREWKPDSAFAFCARLASDEKRACDSALGQRIAWIDPSPAAIAAACAPAGADASACALAARDEHAPDVIAQAAAWAASAPPPSATAPISPASPRHDHAMPMPPHPG
jgi:hypothetical protein